MSTADLLREVCKLPFDDRVKFVQSVMDTIADEDTDQQLSPEFLKEIEARIQAVQADPSICIAWEEVKARARAAKP
jgi:putative addiction module component (TIGR02574 family)